MLNKEKPVELKIKDNCTKCQICANSCPGEYLVFQDGKITANKDSMFGCIQCGRCMMLCPQNAIEIKGEGISPGDVFTLDKNHADYESLYSLLVKRRSTRKFAQKEVSKEVLDKILSAASTGALSIPPFEVKVLVVNGEEKVQQLAGDIVSSLKKMSAVFNSFTINLFRPFIGLNNYKMFKDFILPLIKATVEERQKGTDILFYNAPCVIVFYSTPLCDKEDALIATTLATTAAESLGLGTCIIGTVPPSLNNNKKLKEKYGIAKDETVHSAFILGYPEREFSKGIKRQFKEVKYY